jgi:hypothetical protein
MKIWNGTQWLRTLSGLDDSNPIPGIIFGDGLNFGSNTLSAKVLSVAGRIGDVVLGISDVAGGAPLASPALTGVPTAPTASAGTSTTQIATTAYVRSQIAADTLNYGRGDGLTLVSNNLTVLGTTNRISVSSAGVDIASTYAGQNSISTVGNITSGQWSATPIPLIYGGTGATSQAQARANLNAMAFNNLANSLASVGNGILINNSGTAVPRTIVTGTPDKISIVNGDGVAGNISISVIGGSSGPVDITAGGTGATNATSAFNNLSPANQNGDIIFYNGGTHQRLAGKTDSPLYFLTSGATNALPRWTTGVDSASLGGHDGAYYLARANHTGINNADQLGSHVPAYFLDYANFTGTPPSSAIFAAQSAYPTDGQDANGYVKFAGGLTIQWGRNAGSYDEGISIPITFPIAFTQVFSVNATVLAGTDIYEDWFTIIANGSVSATGFSWFSNHSGSWHGYNNAGFYWMAIGYIA